MDLYRIILELVQERNRIQRIIDSLENASSGKHPPVAPRKRRGRKTMDRAAREEVSERMKRYWAKRRAGQNDPPDKRDDSGGTGSNGQNNSGPEATA
jgi:hypothetical protein